MKKLTKKQRAAFKKAVEDMAPFYAPGSDAALKIGCKCPVMDNGHGRMGPPYWINELCTVHVVPGEVWYE